MSEICIYKFINKVNGKVYVGKTTNFTERIKKHYRRFLSGEQSNLALYRALKKYGWENFSIEKIEECSEEKLNERECYWIEYYDSYFNGYNETRGGDGSTLYDYKKIVELWEQGNLMSEIQGILGCSKGVVQRALNSYKIKDRRARICTPVVQYSLDGNLSKSILLLEKLCEPLVSHVDPVSPRVVRKINKAQAASCGFIKERHRQYTLWIVTN